MGLRNCKVCNALFVSVTMDLCSHCMEEAYFKAKKYLEQHPRATVLELVRDTELSLMTVNNMLRDGMLNR